MALTPRSRGVLLAAALIDVILGLVFILAGAALFGLATSVALIIGLVLIGSGAAMALLTVLGPRRGVKGRPRGKIVDRR